MAGQNDVAELIRALGKIPPALKRTLRPALRAAAGPIASDAKGRASWSTRIPAAIRVSTKLSGRNPGVSIVVDASKAPHARPYEHLGQRGNFRHPVFGHSAVWVAQPARPFLFPAVFAHADETRARIGAAVALAAAEVFED